MQPKQARHKGVTRIINGPKKNAIGRKINHKDGKKTSSSRLKDSPVKPKMNVYDRLYSSKKAKDPKLPSRPKPSPIKKKPKKVKPAKQARNHSAKIPGSRSRSNFSKTKTFRLDSEVTDSQQKKARNRLPTPDTEKVAPLQKAKGDTLALSAKDRVTGLREETPLPHFHSENPS